MTVAQETYLAELIALKSIGHALLDEYIMLDLRRGHKGERTHAYEKLATKLGVPERLAHFSRMYRHETVLAANTALRRMIRKRKSKLKMEAELAGSINMCAPNVTELQRTHKTLLTPQVFTHDSTLCTIEITPTHNDNENPMAREATFTFIPESQLRSTRVGRKHTASLNAKYGYLRMSNDYIRDNKLDGKFIKLYADKSKKAIAWKVMKETGLKNMKGYRQIKMYDKLQNGKVVQGSSLGITSMLKALGIKDTTYKALPIQRYKEQGMLCDEFDYIQLV